MANNMEGNKVCKPLVGSYLDEVTNNENRHIVMDLRIVSSNILKHLSNGNSEWECSSYTITDDNTLVTSELTDKKDILAIYLDTLDQMYSELALAETVESARIDTSAKVNMSDFSFKVNYSTDKNSSLTMNVFYYGNFYYNVPVGRELLNAYVSVASNHEKDALRDELAGNLNKNSFQFALRTRNRKNDEEK